MTAALSPGGQAPTSGAWPRREEPCRFVVRPPRVRTVDHAFRALGTRVRVVVTARRAETLVARAEREILEYDARLSRFRPDSELCALNADPREHVPASPLLREAVAAALWAAERSGGLVDPTLLDALEAAGYRHSFEGRERTRTGAITPADVRSARPGPAARWRAIRVGPATIGRPPGLRLDLGGSGKGHVADRVARLLTRADRFAIDCGGDVRVGGTSGEPQEVHVAHPLTGEIAHAFTLAAGAVATSSICARAWTNPDGSRAHHLLDPATGRPVWTGVVAATSLGRTTLEAETLAKVALLTGTEPDHGLVFR